VFSDMTQIAYFGITPIRSTTPANGSTHPVTAPWIRAARGDRRQDLEPARAVIALAGDFGCNSL